MILAPDKSLFARQGNMQKPQIEEIVRVVEVNKITLVSSLFPSLSLSLSLSLSRSLPHSPSLALALSRPLYTLLYSLLTYTGNAS